MGLVLTLSCSKYPPESDRLLEDLAVLTKYVTKADFSSYTTYSIAGSIMKITDKDTVPMSCSPADAVLAGIDKNMQARGYAQVLPSANPDLGIQVMYFQNTTVYTYYYDWWGYYYPYYPYYPVYYASYTTGMANIEMLDLTDPTSQRAPIRWNAFIRGLLSGDHTTAEITARVDQAFIQTLQVTTTP
jgi:hypothetical protein